MAVLEGAPTPPPDALLTDIADYVNDYRITDSASLAAARLCLFDALACALEALHQPECTRLLGPVVPGTLVPQGARVPGTSHVLDPAKATFDLGALIRWLDYNDACNGILTMHPSDGLAGLLMLGDHLSRRVAAQGGHPMTLADLLDAAVRVYEIQGALCFCNDWRAFGIDQPMLLQAAVAPVLTRLLGGTRQQVFNAVTHAFVDTTLSAIRHAPNIASRKNWACARASEDALRIALMVVAGEAGFPWILSAKDLGFEATRFGGGTLRLEAPLGEAVIQRCMFKLLPAGMHGQTAGECAFLLHPRVAHRLDEIDRIELRCHRSLKRIMDKTGVLRNPADRDHCVQYIVALGLLHGQVGPDDYSDARAADPRIDALRAKMSVTEDPAYTEGFFDPARRTSANSIEIVFRDGTSTGRVEREYPLGHPVRRHEALPALRHKFAQSLRVLPQAAASRLLGLYDQPHDLDAMPVHAFVDLLALPPAVA
jgi:2-methylcitrate dehydratase